MDNETLHEMIEEAKQQAPHIVELLTRIEEKHSKLMKDARSAGANEMDSRWRNYRNGGY